MVDIEHVFSDYTDIIRKVGKRKVKERIESLLTIANDYIVKSKYENKVVINEILLTEAILDYFTDITRLKDFHDIKKVDEIKIISYESFWLLKRKPFQIMINDRDLNFVNEKFIVTIVSQCIRDKHGSFSEVVNSGKLNFFMNSFFYHLKYRLLDAQSIELMIVSFEAGKLYSELSSKKAK